MPDFVGALPAAWLARARGFKASVLVGLLLFSSGALLFLPASRVGGGSYVALLGCLYLIAFGLAFLEASANPWVVLLAEGRRAGSGTAALNLAQAFNPLGSLVGILAGRLLILGGELSEEERGGLSRDELDKLHAREAARVGTTYAGLSGVIACLLLAFALTPFGSAHASTEAGDGSGATSSSSSSTEGGGGGGAGGGSGGGSGGGGGSSSSSSGGGVAGVRAAIARLRRQRAYVHGVGAQFFCIGAQVSVWSFGIRYVQLELGAGETTAADYLLLSLGAFVVGRFAAVALMRCVASAAAVLGGFALAAAVLSALAALGGAAGVACLVGVSAAMGPMFPTLRADARAPRGARRRGGRRRPRDGHRRRRRRAAAHRRAERRPLAARRLRRRAYALLRRRERLRVAPRARRLRRARRGELVDTTTRRQACAACGAAAA